VRGYALTSLKSNPSSVGSADTFSLWEKDKKRPEHCCSGLSV